MPPDAPSAASGGVLFVHAHPDDEAMGTGGSIARLVAAGVPVDLVTCTDGAEGEIHDPELDAGEAQSRLAAIRAEELACALDALGGGSVRHHMLGYRDSGMMGTEANEHPGSFWRSDLDVASRRLVEIVRQARPSAIVSYDENGNYGHPDHINAHRIALAAFEAVDSVDRFYEIAFNRDRWMRLVSAMRERGIELPWSLDESTEEDWGDFGTPDGVVTTRIDVSGHLDRKRRAMECHRTQRQDMGWLLELPVDLALMAMTPEYYVLRRRRSAPVPEGYREDWLVG